MTDSTHPDGADAATSRRQFLRYGAAGLVSAGLAGSAITPWSQPGQAVERPVPGGVLDLYVNHGFVPMVDGSLVYLRGFGERASALTDVTPSLTITPHVFGGDGRLVASRHFPLRAAKPVDGRPAPARGDPAGPTLHLLRRRHWASFFPRRAIVAHWQSTVRLRVHNRLRQPHGFAIRGVVDSGPINPGATVSVEFPAPPPGTYVYEDPTNSPVERVLGLHGVLVVVPADPWRLGPGEAEFERQWVWLCHDIVPEWSRLARMGVTVDPARTPARPRYFTLNERSGLFSIGVSADESVNHAAHEETVVAGSARRTDVRNLSLSPSSKEVITGQLLRLVNTGIAVHQLHFHGNHVWTVRRNGQPLSRRTASVDGEGHILLQQWEDVVELEPLQRKDVVLPLKPPPDALDVVAAAQDCDWHFPMHCHAEMSQTAGGGLYPGGIVADWILAAPLPRDA